MKTRGFTFVVLFLYVVIGINLSAQDNSHSENQDNSTKSDWNIGVYPDGIQRYGHGFSDPNDFTPLKKIEPNWESMAANYKVPEWFRDGKIGIWSHWGPMSAVEDRPFVLWYNRHMYAELPDSGELTKEQTVTKWHRDTYGHPSEFGWEKFIPMFKAEKWDPDELAKFFKDNGACFIMPVACHHNNFDMYNSSHPWNSVKMGPKRDIVGEWKEAAVKHELKFGVSSHLYWSPGYWSAARK